MSMSINKQIHFPKPVIFIAEDDEHISFLLKFLLERQGYLVESAEDGFKFLDLVKESLPPNVILLDMMLPYVDGYEPIRQVRLQERWKHIPIIALSALTNEDDIVRAFRAGANDYVTKPFQPQELIVRIGRFTGTSHDLAAGEN